MLKLPKIERIPNKLKREFLRIPPLKTLSEQAYQKSIAQHSDYIMVLECGEKLPREKLPMLGSGIEMLMIAV